MSNKMYYVEYIRTPVYRPLYTYDKSSFIYISFP